MGTSGLVGQIQTIAVMGVGAVPKILILHIALPAIISYIIAYWMRKKRYINDGDMLINKI